MSRLNQPPEKNSDISNYNMRLNATKIKFDKNIGDRLYPKGTVFPFLFKLSLHNPIGYIILLLKKNKNTHVNRHLQKVKCF